MTIGHSSEASYIFKSTNQKLTLELHLGVQSCFLNLDIQSLLHLFKKIRVDQILISL